MNSMEEIKTRSCPGCGRNELHKWCPAYGTPYYMSGTPYTEEQEKLDKQENRGKIEKREFSQTYDAK